MPALEAENPLPFFKQLHRTFIDLIGAATVRAGLHERLLDEAFQSFDQFVRNASEGAELSVACRGGCASCCTLRVAVTAPEVFLIKHYFEKLRRARGSEFMRDLISRIEQANRSTQGLDESDRLELGYNCPFIENGLCVIYSRRPLACRGHASLSEVACLYQILWKVTLAGFSGVCGFDSSWRTEIRHAYSASS